MPACGDPRGGVGDVADLIFCVASGPRQRTHSPASNVSTIYWWAGGNNSPGPRPGGRSKFWGIVTLIVLGRKGPHGFPFRRPHWHFPIH